MELQSGRPADLNGRQEKEARVYDLLDALGIRYKRVDHPAAQTMEACEEIEKTLGVEICKNLFLRNRQKTEFYLLMMPGAKPFKNKRYHQAAWLRAPFFCRAGIHAGISGYHTRIRIGFRADE